MGDLILAEERNNVLAVSRCITLTIVIIALTEGLLTIETMTSFVQICLANLNIKRIETPLVSKEILL